MCSRAPCIVHSLAADGAEEKCSCAEGTKQHREKEPKDLSSGRMRAIPPLTAGDSGKESSCAGTRLPDCRLGQDGGGMSLGADWHWSLQVLSLAVELLGGFWFKTKALKAHQIVPAWA